MDTCAICGSENAQIIIYDRSPSGKNRRRTLCVSCLVKNSNIHIERRGRPRRNADPPIDRIPRGAS